MALAHITITPEIGDKITAKYNPEKFTVNKSVQFAEIGIPGLDSPVLQFVRGQNEKITMELFFDTTEFGMVDGVTDVRDITGPVYQLLKVNTKTHAPLRFKLEWGEGKNLFARGSKTATAQPWCVMESVTEEFNLFNPTGIPLRARLNVTFREATTVDLQFQETPRHSRTRVQTVKRGQTLSHIAWQEYGDPHTWRPIAEANNLENPLCLDPGTVLLIPNLTTEGS
jgi:hypothetical protein